MNRETQEMAHPSRRGMLAALISAIVGTVPLGIGFAFFLAPLWQRRSAGGNGDDGFEPVGIAIDALPADGTPLSVIVTKDRQNAWNMYPDSPVGSVWLRRLGDGVIAYSSICPHLGCAVEHRSAQNDFFCPCHNSNFSLDGNRLNQIPPRKLDALETKVVDGQIWVKYCTFRAGTTEKTEV